MQASPVSPMLSGEFVALLVMRTLAPPEPGQK
jgi:hypothetical protein